MDRQLIERLTREARFPQPPAQEHMATFAALVAEECAKLAERNSPRYTGRGEDSEGHQIAKAIRAAFPKE